MPDWMLGTSVLSALVLMLSVPAAGADDFDDLLERVRSAEGAGPPGEEVEAELAHDVSDEAIEHRKRLVIEAGAAEEDVNWKARNGKHTFDKAVCRLKLDPDDEIAWDYVPIGMTFRGQGDTFGRSELSRIVRQFEEHIPEELREPLREEVVTYPGYLGGGTENHVVMRRTAGFLMGEMYPQATFHHDLTGEQLAGICLQYMRDYGHAIYDTSMVEYLSPIYHAVNTAAWLNVTELADSAEARITARAVLDWMLLDYAINHAHGIIMPPVQRDKGQLSNTSQLSHCRQGSQWTGWLYWGGGTTPQHEERFVQDAYVPHRIGGTWARLHAVSDWNPHRVIRNIGAKRLPLPYMLWQSRGDWPCIEWSHVNDYGKQHTREAECNPRYQMRSVYVARNYAIGAGYYTEALEDPILRNNTPFAISWRTDDEVNMLRVAHPYWYTARPHDDTGEPLGRDDWTGYSPFMRMVHWENAVIVLFDIPETDPFVGDVPDTGSDRFFSRRQTQLIQEAHVYVPDTIDERVDRAGIIFLREGEVYVAVRPLVKGWRWEQPVWEGWHRLVLPGEVTGAAIEVGDAEEFGSFEGFRQQVLAAQAGLDDGVANYRSTRGHELTVAFADGTWLPDATVNGVALDFERWPTCESPYLTVRDRVLDANDGREGFTIDFTGDLPEYTYYEIVGGERRVTDRDEVANRG